MYVLLVLLFTILACSAGCFVVLYLGAVLQLFREGASLWRAFRLSPPLPFVIWASADTTAEIVRATARVEELSVPIVRSVAAKPIKLTLPLTLQMPTLVVATALAIAVTSVSDPATMGTSAQIEDADVADAIPVSGLGSEEC